MDLFAVELPASRVPPSGQASKLRDVLLDGRLDREVLKVMLNELVEGRPHPFSHFLSLSAVAIDNDGVLYAADLSGHLHALDAAFPRRRSATPRPALLYGCWGSKSLRAASP